MILNLKQFRECKCIEDVLSLCLNGRSLYSLYPDLFDLEPASWSEYSHTITVRFGDRPEDVGDVNVQLYREPLSKSGAVRHDDDPELSIDYAGRLTLQGFWADSGDVFELCMDAGLPESYEQEL